VDSLVINRSMSSDFNEINEHIGKEEFVEGANTDGLRLRNPFRRKPFFPLLTTFFSLLVVSAEDFKGGAAVGVATYLKVLFPTYLRIFCHYSLLQWAWLVDLRDFGGIFMGWHWG
jgi:hypothetical protein